MRQSLEYIRTSVQQMLPTGTQGYVVDYILINVINTLQPKASKTKMILRLKPLPINYAVRLIKRYT